MSQRLSRKAGAVGNTLLKRNTLMIRIRIDSSVPPRRRPSSLWPHWRPKAIVAALALAVAGLTLASAPTQAAPAKPEARGVKKLAAVAQPNVAQLATWHRSILNAPVPHPGCFKVQYPSTALNEVACVVPPKIPNPPRHGALADTVGNGYDYSAQVTGHLNSVTGSFPTASTTGETGFTFQSPSTQQADAYTLQINSSFYASPTACAGSGTPGSCQAWQQYVYSSKSSGSAYMQYWLINYNAGCPSGWNTYGGDCYRNSTSAISVPVIPVTALAQTSMTGSVAANGNDRLDLASSGTHYVVTSPDNIVGLANNWTVAEFTLVGDCCDYQANFNAGTNLAVTTTVHSGTTSAPSCLLAGYTGETNNLNLNNTPPIPTQQAPTILSDQGSTAAGPAACAVASGIGDTHLHTFTPTPQVANGPATNLSYDFQAEGDFILAQSDDGFQVQNRQISGAPQWPNAAVNQAVAAAIGHTTVVFSVAGNKPQVYINGAAVSLNDGEKRLLGADGDLRRHGDTYLARDMRGNSLQATWGYGPTDYIDAYVGLGHWPANVHGLLVNAADNVNVVVSKTNQRFTAPFTFGNFYSGYGDSWRVPANQSLFAKGSGLGAARVGNPAKPFYAANLAPAVAAKARAQCVQAGVKATELADCTLDAAVIGDKRAALTHVNPRLLVSRVRAKLVIVGLTPK